MLNVRTALAALLLVGSAAWAQTRERSQISEADTWDLAHLFPSEDAWREAKEKLAARIPELGKHEKKLGRSPQTLLAGLQHLYGFQRDFYRVVTYANLIADQDTRVAAHQAKRQEMSQLGATFSAQVAYFEPEILKLGKAKVESYLKREPKLKEYRHYLLDLFRRQAHKLSAGEEKIIADAGLMASGPSSINGIFANADFPFPSVKLSDGKEVKIDKTSFQLYRQVPNRADRKKVFETYFGALGKYRNTFGASINANLNRDLFYMRARKYPTTMASALDEDNIPLGVYTSLVKGVNDALPAFHRYLKLRQRMMGIDKVHYHDLYAPLVGDVKLDFPVEKATPLVLAAVKPLGDEYATAMKRAFDERWIDMYPNVGKRAGAYMSGYAYDVHPYVLMNYNGKYEDVTTLIHELGHAMQSHLSNKAQPFATAGYPIFVAEVASTFNEALLLDHMLKTTTDEATRLALLGNYLEGLRTTVFRQTQFAEFEAKIHEMLEQGQPITGEVLDREYLAIARKYYGHEQGVSVVDDYVAHEWANVPHFFYNYYVYQYATSFTASVALSEKVLAGDAAATKRYLEFLSAGGSDYPIALLKKAGVDMTTDEPMRLTVQKMNRVMDEMEALLSRVPPRK